LIRVEGAVAAVAARNRARDLRRQIGYVERFDRPGAALAGQDTSPRDIDAATERRHHADPGDDHTPHLGLLDRTRRL
jgi:hypothetical protein